MSAFHAVALAHQRDLLEQMTVRQLAEHRLSQIPNQQEVA